MRLRPAALTPVNMPPINALPSGWRATVFTSAFKPSGRLKVESNVPVALSLATRLFTIVPMVLESARDEDFAAGQFHGFHGIIRSGCRFESVVQRTVQVQTRDSDMVQNHR